MTSALAGTWTFADRYLENRRYRAVLNRIPDGCVIADLGCGSGRLLDLLRDRVAIGYGIDSSISNRKDGDLRFIRAQVDARIPLDDESVDVVTALALLEHLQKPEVCVGEIFRVLKRGGFCILTTPSPSAKPVLELMAFRLGIISRNDIADHKRYYRIDDLNKLFALFNRVEVSYYQLGLNTIVYAVK